MEHKKSFYWFFAVLPLPSLHPLTIQSVLFMWNFIQPFSSFMSLVFRFSTNYIYSYLFILMSDSCENKSLRIFFFESKNNFKIKCKSHLMPLSYSSQRCSTTNLWNTLLNTLNDVYQFLISSSTSSIFSFFAILQFLFT